MTGIMRLKEKQEYEAWLQEKAAIKRLSPESRENDGQKKKRIADLLAPGNETKFFKYYFSHLADAEFGYFHKKDVKHIVEHPDVFAMLEYPREHAKSILCDIMLPMLLKAKGELSGMMLSSANQQKANTLLADIQAELMFNQRYIADFGEQYNQGAWKDGHFTTTDGVGFWAFGRGVSPRGTRKSDKRPNYGVFDDIEDSTLVRNESRVLEVVDWILGDFFGAMPIKGSRLIGAGNRTHKRGVVAHIVGDIEPDDPKRDGLYHSKVFALENPRTRKKDISEKGVPAWKERYTREMILEKMRKMGWRIALRELFHEHIVEGKTFKEEHLPWVECLPLTAYDALITYNDPSYKANRTSDFKSIVLVGKKGRHYDIIDCFVRQCTTAEMVRGHYYLASNIPSHMDCRHYMEANFIQDLMMEEYWRVGEEQGTTLRIRGDKRKKPDKTVRIENLTPLTEQCFIRFNKAMKHKPDMQELRAQFLGFPDADHDDGPDSVEGAVWLLDKKKGKNRNSEGFKTGQYARSNNRSIY